jgi:hypothetical protein
MEYYFAASSSKASRIHMPCANGNEPPTNVAIPMASIISSLQYLLYDLFPSGISHSHRNVKRQRQLTLEVLLFYV